MYLTTQRGLVYNHRETLAVILVSKRWGHLWANHRVIIYSDNQAAVQIINKGTTSDEIITQELPALFWLSALHNFHVTATYLEGLVTLSPTQFRAFMSTLICYPFIPS